MKRLLSILIFCWMAVGNLFGYSINDIPDGYFSSHGSMCDSCTNNRTDVRYL